MSSGLTATLFASILLHLLGFTALSMVGGSLRSAAPPPNLIPTELLVESPPPVMAEPVPPLSQSPGRRTLWSSRSLCLPLSRSHSLWRLPGWRR